MPKVLNVEQLENKFACLTRARESITSLSSWIMRHSEFCDGIVEEWLAGLSKNFNAINMFYLANDVIMQCGKKRVPKYRTAFAGVLEQAISLPNVREISFEVCRIINIWKSRDLFDEGFCQNLIDQLENKVTETKSPEITEVTELDLIKNYKKEALIDKVNKLKHITESVTEKEEILKYADEPNRADFAMLGSQECQSMLQKVSKYCNTIKGLIKMVHDEIEMRNKVLKELNSTNIFYTSQYEDVKKVAHAYKIYGKKIKKVSKLLLEKKEILFSPEDAISFSDNDVSSPKSPDDAFSPSDNISNLSLSPSSTISDSIEEQSHFLLSKENHETSKTSPFKTGSRNINQNSKIFQIFNEGQELPSDARSEKNNVEKSENEKVSSPTNRYQQPDPSKFDEDKTFDNNALAILPAVEGDSIPRENTDKTNADVDQLLEKSLKRGNIKRKIELLLKTKGKKFCPGLNQQDDQECNPTDPGAKLDELMPADEIKAANLNDHYLKEQMEIIKFSNFDQRMMENIISESVKNPICPESKIETSLLDQRIHALARNNAPFLHGDSESSRAVNLLDQRTNASGNNYPVQGREPISDRPASLLDQRINASSTLNSNPVQQGVSESNKSMSLLDQRIDSFSRRSETVQQRDTESNRSISLLDQRINALTAGKSDHVPEGDAESNRETSLLDQRIYALLRSKDTAQQRDTESNKGMNLLDQRSNALTARKDDLVLQGNSESNKRMSLLDQRINALTTGKSDHVQEGDAESNRETSSLDQRINALFRSKDTVQQRDTKSNEGMNLLDQRSNALTVRKDDVVQQGNSESNKMMSLLDQRINAFTTGKSDHVQVEDAESNRETSLLDQRINALFRSKDTTQQRDAESNQERNLLDQRSNALTVRKDDLVQQGNSESNKGMSLLDQRINVLSKSSDSVKQKDTECNREISSLDQRINALTTKNIDPVQPANSESSKGISLLDQRINALTGNNNPEKLNDILSIESSLEISSLDQRIDLLIKNIDIKNIANLVNPKREESSVFLESPTPMEIDDEDEVEKCEDVDKKQIIDNIPLNNVLNSSGDDVSTELLNSNQTNDTEQIKSVENVQFSVKSDEVDPFFSSLCSSTSSDNKNSIPGLEMHDESETKKETLNKSEDIADDVEKLPSLDSLKDDNLQSEKEVTVKTEPPESRLEDSLKNMIDIPPEDTSLSSKITVKVVNLNDQVDDSKSAAGSTTGMITDVQKTCENSVNDSCKDQSGTATSMVLGQSNRNDKKPKNMLETVCCIFECLSKNKSKTNQEKPCENNKNSLKSLNSDLSFESCLKIYRALQHKNSTSMLKSNASNKNYKGTADINNYFQSTGVGTQNGTSDFCTTTNALHGPILSTFDSSNVSNFDGSTDIACNSGIVKDNLEVADMDCDSE